MTIAPWRDALRRVAAASVDAAPVISLEDIDRFTDQPTRPPEPPHERIITLSPARSVGVRYAVAALVAVLMVALLAGQFLGRAGQGQASPSTGNRLEPVSRAYLSMLRTSYVPLVNANEPAKGCLNVVALAQPAMRAQLMATCRPLMAAELAAARTLAKHLAKSRPPAHWQAQAAALTQATLALISLLTAQIEDIDANNVAQFVNTVDWATSTLVLFLDPITQINSFVGVEPALLPLPLPLMAACFEVGS
jgi:hypothetical protein